MTKLNYVFAALIATGSFVAHAAVAQEVENKIVEAGTVVQDATIGGIGAGTVIAGTVVAGVGASLISNSSGDTIDPVPPVVPKCSGTDPLVSGVCVGTRQETKVTVTGSGTGTGTRTTTVSVPVTFTYAPTAG